MTDAPPESSSDPGGPPLRALFQTCNRKRSHKDALLEPSRVFKASAGVDVEAPWPVDFGLATGVQPDLTEHGWASDAWPVLFERVLAGDILVLTTPIWLGETLPVCTQVNGRIDGNSAQLNDAKQDVDDGRVAGCLVTGNEDGGKHCVMNVLYSPQHLGFVVPRQVNTAWLGEAVPGPSYRDEGWGGPDNDFTNRNVTCMTCNLIHPARMLKAAGGTRSHGTSRKAWNDGERFEHPGPETIRALEGGPSER